MKINNSFPMPVKWSTKETKHSSFLIPSKCYNPEKDLKLFTALYYLVFCILVLDKSLEICLYVHYAKIIKQTALRLIGWFSTT